MFLISETLHKMTRLEAIPNLPLFTPDIKDVLMPQIGLGTYKFKRGSGEAKRTILDALELGYRHIDTAFIYGREETEKEVGNAITQSNIPRSDIFLTTKQWRAYHGYDQTKKCLEKSLDRLQTDYVDLYLIHWPGPNNFKNHKNSLSDIQYLRSETWRAMEDSYYAGKCKSIGVSNFTVRHLEALRKTARIWPPAVNQFEIHPYNPQTEIVEYCQKHGIVVQAYASLGGQDSGNKTWKSLGGKLIDREEIQIIANKHGKTGAQVLLRWAFQQKFSIIPKSTKIHHLRQNLEAISDSSWSGLDASDFDIIKTMNQSNSLDAAIKEKN